MFAFLLATTLAVFAAFCVLDLLHRPRGFPRIGLWRTRGIAAFAIYLAVAFGAPFAWDGALASVQLLDGSALPVWMQVVLGLLVAELGLYGWHRALHRVDVLWRHAHQAHHAAERIDIWGAFWFHPFDTLGFALVNSLCLVGLFGVSAPAGAAINLLMTFLAMFSHANLRTPHWLGWFIVRPEMHAAHHERGVHRDNYADLPILDMIFGTYRNPRAWNGQAGFFDGASNRIGDLLVGRKLA